MKKKVDFHHRPSDDLFRGTRKPAQKAPKNQKRKIFEEIEEEEELEELIPDDSGDEFNNEPDENEDEI